VGVALLFLISLGLMLAPGRAQAQAQSTYLNLGTVTTAPQIDATNFVNKGLFDIETAPNPFFTTSTLNYTNTGEMVASVGWEFDFGPLPSGGRGLAANFYNGPYNGTTGNGLIESVSGLVENPSAAPLFAYPVGYLLVSATNIVNKGALVADAASQINLTGTNVNLSRSYVYIEPVGAIGSINATNFTPDSSIYDLYWAIVSQQRFDGAAVWDGATVTLPPGGFQVTEPCGTVAPGTLLSFSPTLADYTNYAAQYGTVTITNDDGSTGTDIIASNTMYEAIFVVTADPNITPADGFSPSVGGTENFEAASVELSSSYGDLLSIVDTLAPLGAQALLPNADLDPASPCYGAYGITYRPTNYLVERIPISLGSPGEGPPPADIFFQPGFTNPVPAVLTGYSCLVDNQAFEPPANPNPLSNASAITNLPGRINISAASLDLSDTVIRGEGEVVVNSSQFINSQNASVDCENLSFNLGATNGFLSVTNLVPPGVERFHGTVSMISAVWTNYTFVVLTNNYAAVLVTNGTGTNAVVGTNYVLSPLTNIVQASLYAFTVDASRLESTAPVTVYDMHLQSTNMTIYDSMNVVESFLLSGPSFTLNGNLSFPGTSPLNPISQTPFVVTPIQNWVYTMAPNLRYFTNNAVLTIANDAHFGDDGPTNYRAFVNNGSIIANDQTIDSAYLLINNALNESGIGDFSAVVGSAVLSNSLISAMDDVDIAGNTNFVTGCVLSADGAFNFLITNSFSDGGVGAGNSWNCENGFNLWVKPQTGDLWGTTMTTASYGFEEVDHIWAGADRGPNGAGFTNNASLGALVLSPQSYSAPALPLFYFFGAGLSNGMYVGTLDLSQMGTNGANLNQMIAIDPSLTIYFANALLGFSPPGGATANQYLDGQFGGHLRWVKNFTGIPTAKASVVPNRMLSANYAGPGGNLRITMNAAPGQLYVVETSTDLINWSPVFTNTAPINGLFQYVDPNPATGRSRFYRVVTAP
jgi:hypothetical protein